VEGCTQVVNSPVAGKQTTRAAILGQTPATFFRACLTPTKAMKYNLRSGAKTATWAVAILTNVGGLMALYWFNVPPLIILRFATLALCGVGLIEAFFAFNGGHPAAEYLATAFSVSAALLLVVSMFLALKAKIRPSHDL
jgi:hypothetical protein